MLLIQQKKSDTSKIKEHRDLLEKAKLKYWWSTSKSWWKSRKWWLKTGYYGKLETTRSYMKCKISNYKSQKQLMVNLLGDMIIFQRLFTTLWNRNSKF